MRDQPDAAVAVLRVEWVFEHFHRGLWPWPRVVELLRGAGFATYLIMFRAMLDLEIAPNPMFGSGPPGGWAQRCPGTASPA